MINSDQKLATFAKLTIIRQLEKGVERGLNSPFAWDVPNHTMGGALHTAMISAMHRGDWASVATYAIMLEARQYNNRRQTELENGNG